MWWHLKHGKMDHGPWPSAPPGSRSLWSDMSKPHGYVSLVGQFSLISGG